MSTPEKSLGQIAFEEHHKQRPSKQTNWAMVAAAVEAAVLQRAALTAAQPVQPAQANLDFSELKKAACDAAESLETIYRLAGRETYGSPPIETCMSTFMEVRGYAKSRATAAKEEIEAAMKYIAQPAPQRAPSSFVNAAGINSSDNYASVIHKLDAAFHDAVTFANPSQPAALPAYDLEALAVRIDALAYLGAKRLDAIRAELMAAAGRKTL